MNKIPPYLKQLVKNYDLLVIKTKIGTRFFYFDFVTDLLRIVLNLVKENMDDGTYYQEELEPEISEEDMVRINTIKDDRIRSLFVKERIRIAEINKEIKKNNDLYEKAKEAIKNKDGIKAFDVFCEIEKNNFEFEKTLKRPI